jgi:hypothetical protein
VKIFGVVAAIAVAAFAGLHLAGDGMRHGGHGTMAAPATPAEHHHP